MNRLVWHLAHVSCIEMDSTEREWFIGNRLKGDSQRCILTFVGGFYDTKQKVNWTTGSDSLYGMMSHVK